MEQKKIGETTLWFDNFDEDRLPNGQYPKRRTRVLIYEAPGEIGNALEIEFQKMGKPVLHLRIVESISGGVVVHSFSRENKPGFQHGETKAYVEKTAHLGELLGDTHYPDDVKYMDGYYD